MSNSDIPNRPRRGRGRPRHEDEIYFYVSVTAAIRMSGLTTKEFYDDRRHRFIDTTNVDWHGHWRILRGESLRRRYGSARRTIGILPYDETHFERQLLPDAALIAEIVEQMVQDYMSA